MNDVERIELTIDQARNTIALMQSLDRLSQNKDFQDIIDNGYFRDEAVRLVHLRSDPQMQEDHMRRNIDEQIMAVGSFRGYLNRILQQGHAAQSAIMEHEQTREELLQEDLDNE